MRKIAPLSLLLALLLLLQCAAVPALATGVVQPVPPDQQSYYTATDASVLNGCHSVDAKVPLLGSDRKLRTSASAILYEVNSDTMVYAWNPDQKLYPASLVKILTTLIAVERGNLSDVITVSATALASVPDGMSGEKLLAGEQLTLEQLLHLTMVGSSNHAAAVVAEYISGSQGMFALEMNKRAKELGCTASNFVNPHGLHDENQYTTARDMCRIVREAMKNESFMVFFSTIDYDVPATNLNPIRYLATTNYLMTPGVSQVYYDRRVTGGRTGVTDARERSLAATAKSGDLSYITIVMCAVPTFDVDNYSIKRFGSYEETKDLLKMAFDNMSTFQIMDEEQITAQYPTSNGSNSVVAGPSSSAFTVLPSNLGLKDLTLRYEQNYMSLNAPIKAGDKITSLQIWYGSVCLGQADIVAKNTVEVASASNTVNVIQSDNSSGLLTGIVIIGIAVLIVAAVAGGLRLIRYIRISQFRAQQRRRRSGRKRSR